MKLPLRRILLPLGVVVCICAIVAWTIFYLPLYAVSVHQRSVTNSLAEWEVEYGTIDNWNDAYRTAEMLEYSQRYYIPGEGYHGFKDVEIALQHQRQKTMNTFVTALQTYTKQDFGTDAKKWQEYLKQHRSRSNLPDNIEMGM